MVVFIFLHLLQGALYDTPLMQIIHVRLSVWGIFVCYDFVIVDRFSIVT